MKVVAPKALTITELTRRIKKLIESDAEMNDVFLCGEISNFTNHPSGHKYFSLKDNDAQIRAVMFRGSAETLTFKPQDGHFVEALCSVTVYERRGEYQVIVRSMRPAGLGALFNEFEKLKKKLESEGLFDAARKRPIPAFPRHIAVVTSPTGAALRDIIHIIRRRCPALELTVVPTLVQGNDAPASIIKSLSMAARLNDVDVLILARGGGSIEDLWAFNDEKVARAIAAHPVPVISGVGHETDFTIADFVSDLRAPTPSAAAVAATPDLMEMRRRVDSVAAGLRRGLEGRMRLARAELDTLRARIAPDRLMDQVNQRRQDIDYMTETAHRVLERRVESHRSRLLTLAGKLVALDPTAILDRGYALVADEATGRLIRSAAQAKPGRSIVVRISDGDFRARVEGSTRQRALMFED